MAREFVPFDEDEIDKELDDLEKASISDAAKLDFCRRRIEQVSPKVNPSPAFIRSFDEGFLELRHVNDEYKGRLLYYVPKVPKGTEDLVILVVFRKEGWKTPRSKIELAVRRMNADMARRKEEENN